MKKSLNVLLIFFFLAGGCNQPGDTGHLPGVGETSEQFPVLRGEYLGQKKPGLTPELFAPGIISTGLDELNSVFTPDGKEFYFALRIPVRGFTIMVMKQEDHRWTGPQVAPFSGKYSDVDHMISPTGNRLFFSSNRPLEGNGTPRKDYDIWVVERTPTGWTEPQNIGPVINSESHEFYPSITGDGTIYFTSNRKGGKGEGDIYRSRFLNDRYTNPENLGESINSKFNEHDAFIAQDESYIIFASSRPTDNYGGDDLYISFPKEDGSWTTVKNMGEAINTSASEYCPVLSPGGKFFFFTSHRSFHKTFPTTPLTYNEIMKILKNPGNSRGDVYWVDSKIIEVFKVE